MTYLVLRAIFVQPLHDEIASFFRYIHINELWPWASEWSANNHYLNTVLSWISYKAFGFSAFSLRLPNLIFFPVFYYYLARISSLIENKILRWGLVLTILFSHNFIEFFALARGYGISMAFLLGTIWHLIQFTKNQSLGSLYLSLLLIALGSFANLTLVNTLILLSGLYLLAILIRKDSLKAKILKLVPIIIIQGIVLMFFVTLLLWLNAEGELYYGESKGFYQNFIRSMSKLLYGHKSDIFSWVIISYALLMLFLFAKKYIRGFGFSEILKVQNIFLILLFGNVIGILSENYLFGTNLPEDRTGLFYFPLFIGSLFFSFDKLHISKKKWSLLLLAPLLFFPVHFIVNFNISWSSVENQNIPARFYDYISEESEHSDFPPTVQGYHMRIMRWSYLNFTSGQELACISVSDYPRDEADFQIIEPSRHPDWQDLYTKVDSAEHSGLLLLERKKKLNHREIFNVEHINSDPNTNSEFFSFYKNNCDSVKGKDLYFGFNLKLISADIPFHGWMVVSFSNADGYPVRYDFSPLDWYRTKWPVDGKIFTNGILVHDVPQEATEFIVYIWNIRKSSFTVEDASLSVMELSE